MKCFICGNSKKFRKLKDVLCKTNNYLCLTCGLIFIPRTKSKSYTYYKNDGYFKQSPNRSLQEFYVSRSLLIEQARKRIALTVKVMPVTFVKKSVLDIGCAYGELLYLLKKKYKSKVMGIEPSSGAAQRGTTMFQVPIKPVLLHEFKSKTKFDIILCNHTLEHVDDPASFLSTVKQLMHSRSLLYIEVPNVLNPTGNFELDTFFYSEHLQTFSSYNLGLFFHKLGFSIEAYADQEFLRFFVRLKKKTAKELPPKIEASYIYSRLLDYKKNYSTRKKLYVYINKGKYALHLVFYKIRDLVTGFQIFT